jgi:hypothetical protein
MWETIIISFVLYKYKRILLLWKCSNEYYRDQKVQASNKTNWKVINYFPT